MANTEQIRTFLEVARMGSFIQAAKALNLPRSTVTARINALETRLNTRLLHRTTRAVSLTAEGGRFYQGCADAMESLARAEDDLTSRHVVRGMIRVSIPIDFPKKLMAELLSAFKKEYPDVAFHVHVSDEPVDLVADLYDIALRARHPGGESLIARKIKSDRLHLLAPNGSNLPKVADINRPGLRTIDPTGLVCPVATASTETDASPTGHPEHGSDKTRNFELATAIALAEGAYVVLPEGMAKCEVDSGDFRLVQTTTPLPELPLFYVLPSRDFVPQRVRRFADFLTARLRD
jgi:DNA-binding transcriptional LysR family regulator